jgi:TolB-like protein/DNA-binding winged helix-turn-helix (wHTH) protein/cytochrome c-type biogenesis protein CcmH/NrfG
VNASASSVLRFGVFELDARTGELRKSGALIRLPPQPLKVLALLASRSGELVTREELQAQIWGNETFVDFEQGLNHCIKQIRVALGDDAETPRFIETLPRRGYRFLAPVSRPDGPDAGAITPPAATRAAPRRALLTAAIALVAVVAGSSYLFRDRLPFFRPAPTGRVLLAVLPFENLSGDPEQEFFSDGLTDEMITQLGSLRLERLGVISRTSAMRYKHTAKTAAEIGRELGVDFILEGAVRRDGGRVRITTQLIQVRDQTHLWVESFEDSLDNVLDIQKNVARRVAASLAFELLPAQLAAIGGRNTPNPAARDFYLKGLYWSYRGVVREAAENFRKALDADPGYALAYAGLANTLLFASPAPQFMPRAKTAALRALELNPSLPEAHSALGMVKLMYDWDFPAAEKAFLRALELDPSNAETHLRYSNYLATVGRIEEAIAQARRGQQLDPLAPLMSQAIGRYYHFLGDEDRAILAHQEALRVDPDSRWAHLFISFSYERKEMYEEWIAHQRKAWIQFTGNDIYGARLDRAYRAGGYPAALREVIAYYEDGVRRGQMASAALAINYLKAGDKEKALYWLEKAFEAHTRDLIYLSVEPEYDLIRDDPRFQEIVRKIGLPNTRKK